MAILYSGTEGTCQWTIDDQGHLYIGDGVISHNTTSSSDWSWDQYRQTIVSVLSGNVSWAVGANAYGMFSYFSSLQSIDLSNFDTTDVTSMSFMFDYCRTLTSLDLSNFETSNVTNMSRMFNDCYSLIALDLSNFDTSNVTNMNGMFNGCHSLTSIDLSNFNTSNVTAFFEMFGGCSLLVSLNLSNFNTSNVTNMSAMFLNCSSLTTLDLSNFDISSIIDIDRMFYNCSSLTGNIYFRGSINNIYHKNDMFFNTTQPIYIIQNTNNPVVTIAEFWRSIAQDYSNVYYEADGHINYPSTISGEVTRINDDGNPSTNGRKARIDIRTEVSDNLIPKNVIGPAATRFANTITITISIDGATPISGSNGSNIINFTSNPYKTHTFVCTISDINTSSNVTLILSPVLTLLDFLGKGSQGGYIDLPGMGMAIGKSASRDGLDIQFPTTIGDNLIPATQPVNPVASTATTIDVNTNYYTYNSEIDRYYRIDNPDTEANPSNEGWFEAENEAVDLYNYQLVVGKYNKQNNDAVFIIGNGSNNNNRSNLMEVGDNLIRIGNENNPHFLLKGDSIISSYNNNILLGLYLDKEEIIEEQFLEHSDSSLLVWDVNLSQARKDQQFPNTGLLKVSIEYSNNNSSPLIKSYEFAYDVTGWQDFTSETIADIDLYIGNNDSTLVGSLQIDLSKARDQWSGTVIYNITYHIDIDDSLVSSYDVLYTYPLKIVNETSYRFGEHSNEKGRGLYSFIAGGTNNQSQGDSSFVAGRNNTSAYNQQTIIGKYNDNQSNTVFEIGNGQSENSRSNAFTVDWQGRVECGDFSGVYQSLFDIFYPVGSYYETSDANFNPNTAWGGTWTKLGEGVVLMSGGGSNYSVGTTYGGNTKNYTPAGNVSVTVATHAITVAEMPSHNHGEKTLTAYFSGRRCGNDSVSYWGGTNTSVTASSTAVTTSSAAGTSNKHQDIVNINMTHTHTSNGSGSAHGHPNSTGKFTGTQATINVMQSSLATYIWHRTA